MKIFHKKGEAIRQFSTVLISCRDSVMADILGGTDNIRACSILLAIRAFRRHDSSFFEYCTRSGAKVKCGGARDTFYIYSYSYNGQDGLDAIDELLTLDAVRLAAKRVESTYNGAFKLKLS